MTIFFVFKRKIALQYRSHSEVHLGVRGIPGLVREQADKRLNVWPVTIVNKHVHQSDRVLNELLSVGVRVHHLHMIGVVHIDPVHIGSFLEQIRRRIKGSDLEEFRPFMIAQLVADLTSYVSTEIFANQMSFGEVNFGFRIQL